MNNPFALEPPLPDPQFADHLKCSLCLDFLRKPVMAALSCGHRFCETEIKTALLTNRKCPICRANVRELMHDHFAESTLDIYYAQNPGVVRRPDCEPWTGEDPFDDSHHYEALRNGLVVEGNRGRMRIQVIGMRNEAGEALNLMDYINEQIHRDADELSEVMRYYQRGISPPPPLSPAHVPAVRRGRPNNRIRTVPQARVRRPQVSTGGTSRQRVVPTARLPDRIMPRRLPNRIMPGQFPHRITPAPPCPTRRRRRGPVERAAPHQIPARRPSLRSALSQVRRDAEGRQISRSGRHINAPTPFQA